MDGGKMAEFDEPYNLLQNKQSIFYGMVKAMGDQEFDQLLSDKFTNKWYISTDMHKVPEF